MKRPDAMITPDSLVPAAAAGVGALATVTAAEWAAVEASWALPAAGGSGALTGGGGAAGGGALIGAAPLAVAVVGGLAVGCLIACDEYFEMKAQLEEEQDDWEYTVRAIDSSIATGDLPADFQVGAGRGGQPPPPPPASGQCDPEDFDDELRDAPDDGSSASVEALLDAAERFLGPGYSESPPGSGRYLSADGCRQVRLGNSDITGRHGGGPHANFETLEMNPLTGRMRVASNHHVYFVE